MVSIETCHPGDPSSIPCQTKLFFLKKIAKVPEPFRELRHSCEFLSGKFCKFKSWPHVKIAKVCILYPFAEKLREFNAQVFFINEFVTIFTHFHRIYWFSWSKFDLTEKSSCLTASQCENYGILVSHFFGKNFVKAQRGCSVCEVEITPVIDNTFEFPAFDAETP